MPSSIFFYEVIIPADTEDSDPYKYDCYLAAGNIKTVSFGLPPTLVPAVKVSLWLNEVQIIPANRGGYIRWENQIFSVNLDLPLLEPPYLVQLRASSPQTRFDHAISLWIELGFSSLNYNNPLELWEQLPYDVDLE